jgi:hypothetical protein
VPLVEHVQVQEFVVCVWLGRNYRVEEFQGMLHSQSDLHLV